MGYNKSIKGFTLIELMVVVAITGIVSTFAVINFKVNSQRRNLDNQALLVLDGLKQAQTYALSSQQQSGQAIDSYVFSIDACPAGNCFYKIVASSTAPVVVFRSELKDSLLTNAVKVSFKIPRGDVSYPLAEDVVTIISRENASLQKCIGVQPVSGRMEIVTCP